MDVAVLVLTVVGAALVPELLAALDRRHDAAAADRASRCVEIAGGVVADAR